MNDGFVVREAYMIDPIAFTINLGEGAIVKDIYWYGIIIAVGMLLALFLATKNAKKLGMNPETIIDFAIFVIIFAVLGARAHYVVWSWEKYQDVPIWKIFAIWEGGLAIFGGIIGGIFAAFIFTKAKRISMLKLLDITAPSLILGQAIGRWGNFTNQEAYGYPVFNDKFKFFPLTVFIQETQQYHLATFFYESMWNLVGFIILMVSLRKSKREGKTFFLYMIIYGLGRVIIEGLRTDSQMFMNTDIRVNQVFSAIFIIVGAAMYLFYRNAKDYVLLSEDEIREERKSKPGKIKVHKAEPSAPNSAETVADEYKAMKEEMRKQRESLNRDKE